ncbi:MAG: hypothetical protein KJT03_15960, partial [Verrucomicrobiae bacterium]|nr:hypothetical protein [Verrucomicrobiae bacterium]
PVPSNCDQVVRIDCDVVFQNAEWMEEAGRLLENYRILQLFDRAYYLPRHECPDAFNMKNNEASRVGLVSAVAS